MRLLRRAVRTGLDRPGGRLLLAVMASIVVSVSERRPVRIATWGGMWRYRFGAREVWSNQLLRARCFDDDLEIALWRYRPQPGDVVVDVGAGTGTEAIPFANMVGPTGRVVAIEAHPATAAVLRHAVRAADCAVEVVQAAVCDRVCEVTLGDSGEAGTNSLFDRSGVTVSGLSLDVLFDRLELDRVDLLKMNIEGAERLAIAGLADSIGRVRRIVVSCHDFLGTDWGATRDEVLAWLLSHGFHVDTRRSDPRPWCRDYLYATAPGVDGTSASTSAPAGQAA